MTKQTIRMLKSRAEFNREVMGRDMNCRAYKDNECSGYLAPHHIVGRVSVKDDVLENGITLCTYHHQLITDGHLKVHASWLDQNQIDFIETRKWKMWDKIIWDRE